MTSRGIALIMHDSETPGHIWGLTQCHIAHLRCQHRVLARWSWAPLLPCSCRAANRLPPSMTSHTTIAVSCKSSINVTHEASSPHEHFMARKSSDVV